MKEPHVFIVTKSIAFSARELEALRAALKVAIEQQQVIWEMEHYEMAKLLLKKLS